MILFRYLFYLKNKNLFYQCYLSFEFDLVQRGNNIQIWIWNLFKLMALAHLTQLAQPAHLTWLSRPGSGLGRSTDPAQPPRAPLSPLELTSDTASPPPPGLSGQLRWSPPSAPWARYSPPRPIPSPPKGFVGRLLSEEIWVVSPLGICRLRAPPMRCLDVLGPAELGELALVLEPRECSPVEASRSDAPGVAWWRLPQAASGWPRRPCPALPCHPDEHLGDWWALLLLSNPLLLSLATVSNQLVKITELSSQTLVCAAVCLMPAWFSECTLVV
jgi:hypothetical protein